MKEYMLLLRGGDARMADMSEKETKEHMDRWGAYMGDLAQKGHLVGGMPLQQDARLVTKATVTEEVVESKKGEAIGGWLHLKASDYNQAVELSKECPIFEHDGNIEIREVMEMKM